LGTIARPGLEMSEIMTRDSAWGGTPGSRGLSGTMNGPRRRIVVVTGASAGVGRAIAQAFARQGDVVGLIARHQPALEEVRAEVDRMGGVGVVLPADVADAEAIEAAAAEMERRFGPPDIWVNNAMVSVFSPFREMTAKEFRRVTEVTYLGFVYGTMSALKRMLPRDSGVVVQVGSALAYRGIPLQSAYCGAKHAIQGFNESLRTELIHDGSNVRVTMVQLPAMNTPQFDWVRSRLPGRAQPVPPIFAPELAADAVLWAAEHDRRELNVSWSAERAILGNKLVPGLIDHYLARTGVDGQQTEEPEDPDRPDNLWEPVAGLHRTRGRFEDRAARTSRHFWLVTHPWQVTAVGAAAAASLIGALRLFRGGRHDGAGEPSGLRPRRRR
jgi:NAD(P)-dependent dehydrogenase (short-subunit alcohol dehydrogenase family)